VSVWAQRRSSLPRTFRLGLLAELGGLAVVIAAAAYVYTRNLHSYLGYDEGNYLGSLDALRHGQALGRDVFLDQPPGWYLLLVAVSYPFGNSVSGVRTGLMAVSLLAIVAAYACGRLAAGPLAGVAAAGVMSVARPFPGFAGLVESEPASAALAVVAIALALGAYRDRLRPWLAFAAGVALAAATAVKLPGATAGVPIAALALLCGSGSIVRRLLPPLAGAAALCAVLLVSYRNALPQIWRGVVVTHARILGTRTPQSNVHRALTFVDPRTPFGCLVIAGAAASAVVAVLGRSRRLLAALWLWGLCGYAFILAMHPLSDHHFVFLAVSLALPAGVGLGVLSAALPRRAAAAAAVAVASFVAAGFYQQRHEIIDSVTAKPPEITWAIDQVRAHTRPGQLVVSDLPAVPYLAGRQMPGELIDTSIARIADGDLLPTQVLKLIDEAHPAAVIIGRMFQTKPVIVNGVRARYGRPLHYQLHPGYVDVYLAKP
jgi:4-amino-4-deoxy-L-arabinose transferase-like glycosyltransferase